MNGKPSARFALDAPILLVDDEEQALSSYELALRYSGFNCTAKFSDPRQALSFIETSDISLAVIDLRMPHLGGEELLPRLREKRPGAPVIVVTGEADVETAVRCMRAGSTDYLIKPADPVRFIASVERALALRRGFLRLAQPGTQENAARPEAFAHIVHESPEMEAICGYIAAIAASLEPVFITGETGAGKEMAAKAVHRCSRAGGPFVAVNAAGLDDAMFADTLFGHSRGAFTGAQSPRPGLIERASGGSLFLDEIGDLSHASQLKLLRLLEEREYYPVGSDAPKKTDARIIAATNLPLESLLDQSRFRRDLFYRLRTHHIHLPSLRERVADIAPLARHFLDQAREKLGKPLAGLSGKDLRILCAHDFPGNVRELRALIFDAAARSKSGELDLAALADPAGPNKAQTAPKGSPQARPSEAGPDRLPTLRQAEEDLVDRALALSGGNLSAAARVLGISRQALSKRLLTKKRA